MNIKKASVHSLILVISFNTLGRVWIWPCSFINKLPDSSPRLFWFFFNREAKFIYSFFHILIQISCGTCIAISSSAQCTSGIWKSDWVFCAIVCARGVPWTPKALVQVFNILDPVALISGEYDTWLPDCWTPPSPHNLTISGVPVAPGWEHGSFAAVCCWFCFAWPLAWPFLALFLGGMIMEAPR